MSAQPRALLLTRGDLRQIVRDHRQLQTLLGKLERSNEWRECITLRAQLDEAFYAHSERELEILGKTAAQDAGQFTELDQRHHSMIEDLLFQLGNLVPCSDAFRAKVCMIRDHMSEHMLKEEDHLGSGFYRFRLKPMRKLG